MLDVTLSKVFFQRSKSTGGGDILSTPGPISHGGGVGDISYLILYLPVYSFGHSHLFYL